MDHVTLHGIDLHYQRVGQGPPLLLLHGFSGRGDDWQHAGRDRFAARYGLVVPDARGHGATANPLPAITHRQCALDTLALLDHLGIERVRAVGMSMGGNILLHMATMAPDRIEAMVTVSATLYYPEQARRIMRASAKDAERALADDYDDMAFTPAQLSRIRARTLVVYGDRDPLYPIEMALDMFRAIPQAELWIVPGGGHGPIFLEAAEQFATTALRFLDVGLFDAHSSRDESSEMPASRSQR
jgi:pimeloyl-ACP methyl ester carboxylesterase